MAQLRYAKAVACGTALTAAGLAGYYLYTRNNLKKARMKGDDEMDGEENTGKGTEAIEERLRIEAEMEKQRQASQKSDKTDGKKCDCSEGGACKDGCTPDIEAIEKVLEKLDAEELAKTKNENENLGTDRHVEESIENVVEDFMMECSMDTNASSGSSLNVSNEHIVEDLQKLDEAIPSPVEEVMVLRQTQPVQEAIVPVKRQTLESSIPPLMDNANHTKTSTIQPLNSTLSISNGNMLDNQKSVKFGVPNGKGGKKNKQMNNTFTNGKGSLTPGKKGGFKKSSDLTKLQNVDWASSMLLEEKSRGPHVTSMGTHDGNSTGCDVSEVNSEGSSIDSGHGSRDSGASASPAAIPPNALNKEGPVVYQFEFPSKLCGRLIGKSGKNIRELKDKTGAKVILKNVPYSNTYQICVVEGLRGEVDGALAYIKRKFPTVDLARRANTQEQPRKKAIPDMTQLHLPEEMPNSILISSVVSGGHVFIQQPMHQTFQGLSVQDNLMTQIYQQADMTPQLPRPIETGVICAAPVMDGWYRAQVVEVSQETDEVDVRFLDYGGYARVEGYALRQIRSDFLGLPFQATECYMSNISPLPNEADFSEACRIYVEQLAQSIGMMQATITGYSVDGIPFIEIFFMDSQGRSQSVNKQLVNQGLVSWYEGAEAVEPINEGLPPLMSSSSLYSLETSVRPS